MKVQWCQGAVRITRDLKTKTNSYDKNPAVHLKPNETFRRVRPKAPYKRSRRGF